MQLSQKPAVIVIIAGVNDIYQGRSAESVEMELEKMYNAARALQAIVVAGTIIPFNTASADQNARMHAVNDWIRAYTASHGNSLVSATRAPLSPHRDSLTGSCPLPTTFTRPPTDTDGWPSRWNRR